MVNQADVVASRLETARKDLLDLSLPRVGLAAAAGAAALLIALGTACGDISVPAEAPFDLERPAFLEKSRQEDPARPGTTDNEGTSDRGKVDGEQRSTRTRPTDKKPPSVSRKTGTEESTASQAAKLETPEVSGRAVGGSKSSATGAQTGSRIAGRELPLNVATPSPLPELDSSGSLKVINDCGGPNLIGRLTGVKKALCGESLDSAIKEAWDQGKALVLEAGTYEVGIVIDQPLRISGGEEGVKLTKSSGLGGGSATFHVDMPKPDDELILSNLQLVGRSLGVMVQSGTLRTEKVSSRQGFIIEGPDAKAELSNTTFTLAGEDTVPTAGSKVLGRGIGTPSVPSGPAITAPFGDSSNKFSTPSDCGDAGISVGSGGSLLGFNVVITGAHPMGVCVMNGTATLRLGRLENGAPGSDGYYGWGAGVFDGGSLRLSDVEVRDNREVSVLANGKETQLTISGDSMIEDVIRSSKYSIAPEVVVQNGATGTLTDFTLTGDMPGLLVSDGGTVTAIGVSFDGNSFAAVVLLGGDATLDGVHISGTREDRSEGGGVGIYSQDGNLTLRDSTIEDNLIAGVWLEEGDSLVLEDNLIQHNRAVELTAGREFHGNGILALGVLDGLEISANRFENEGAQVLLHGSNASFGGANTFIANGVLDFKQQSCDEDTVFPVDSTGAGLTSSNTWEICEGYDDLLVTLDFNLRLEEGTPSQ